MHTLRKPHEEDFEINASWPYSLGPYNFTVGSVSGTGSITFTAGATTGTLGTNASYTPPSGAVPGSNGGNLGQAPVSGQNNVTNVSWDGTTLSFSYSGYTYSGGQHQSTPTGTTFIGNIQLPNPSPTAVQKNWQAQK